jgi:hypothetical protein
VIAVVRAENRAVRADGDAVGAIGEFAFAPRTQKIAFLVVHHHRVIAAANEIHAVLAIACDPRHVAVNVAVGQLLPALDDGILNLP